MQLCLRIAERSGCNKWRRSSLWLEWNRVDIVVAVVPSVVTIAVVAAAAVAIGMYSGCFDLNL